MDPLAPLITALHAEGRLRAGSLVITVFGDAVQPRGGRIAAARLHRLLERLGVGAGTLRTALSRLAADDWIRRDRDGRNSFYRLSARGGAEFAPATARIYAPPPGKPVTEWQMRIGADAGVGLEVQPGVWLSPAAPAGTGVTVTGALAGPLGPLVEASFPPAYRAALALLWADLDALRPERLEPLDAMAARTLLIHRWRRIVLRFPELPDQLLPAAFADPGPRARVAIAYAALKPGADAWLDQVEPGYGAMPPEGQSAPRFAP